jgi:hypothetical protein
MTLQSLNSKNFGIFADLFTPGGSGCYCAVWRAFDASWEQRCKDRTHPNRDIARKYVSEGTHWGFLAFNGPDLVGWTASGPKIEFPLLESKLGSRLSPFISSIWSIGCIAVKNPLQKHDATVNIVKAVAKQAHAAGAEFLEAYPTDPWDVARSYRGSLKIYEALGFKEFSADVDGDSRILCMRLGL